LVSLDFILERADVGYDRDERTPLWESRDRCAILDELDSAIGVAPYPLLAELDDKERELVGPLSIRAPYADREDDVKAYFTQSFDADVPSFERALRRVNLLIPNHSVRPLSWDNAYDHIPHNKWWGLPWATSDPSVGPWYLENAPSIVSPEQVYPSVIGWRGQAHGPTKGKDRVVWMACKLSTIIEATLMYPLLSSLRTCMGFSAWGTPDDVDVAITKLMETATSRQLTMMSGDYSGFDASVSRHLIDAVFDALMGQWLVPEMSSRLELCKEIFATGGICVPYKVLDGRNGGVPSGSVFTNLVDSLINLVAGYYTAERYGVELLRYEVMGDDSVFVFNPSITSEELSNAVGELGLKMNPEKQYVHDDAVHYLQRLYVLEHKSNGIYRGMHNPYRSMSGLTGIEYFHTDWDEYLVSARAIMQVENVKHDPRFPEFVEFVYDGDQLLRSGMDPAEIIRRAGGAERIRDSLDKQSFPYNVYDPDAVETFTSTDVIRSLQS
jgi:hypothetical protein